VLEPSPLGGGRWRCGRFRMRSGLPRRFAILSRHRSRALGARAQHLGHVAPEGVIADLHRAACMEGLPDGHDRPAVLWRIPQSLVRESVLGNSRAPAEQGRLGTAGPARDGPVELTFPTLSLPDRQDAELDTVTAPTRLGASLGDGIGSRMDTSVDGFTIGYHVDVENEGPGCRSCIRHPRPSME
jgi:hypothetical protein